MDNQFLTVKEISEYLRIKPATLYSKVESGNIPHYKVGRLVRFRRGDIDQWMEDHRRDPSDANKRVKAILGTTKRGSLDIDQLVKKSVDEVKQKTYNLRNRESDQDRGLGKEVSNGNL